VPTGVDALAATLTVAVAPFAVGITFAGFAVQVGPEVQARPITGRSVKLCHRRIEAATTAVQEYGYFEIIHHREIQLAIAIDSLSSRIDGGPG